MKISRRIAASRPMATTAMHGRVEAFRNEGVVIDFSIAISHSFTVGRGRQTAPADILIAERRPLNSMFPLLPAQVSLNEARHVER